MGGHGDKSPLLGPFLIYLNWIHFTPSPAGFLHASTELVTERAPPRTQASLAKDEGDAVAAAARLPPPRVTQGKSLASLSLVLCLSNRDKGPSARASEREACER